MIKQILFLFIIFVCSLSVKAQSTYFTDVDTLRVKTDTVSYIEFISSPKALYTMIVLINDTTSSVVDTIQVYNITERNDTIQVGLRDLTDWTANDITDVVALSGKKEYLILNPDINRVFIKLKATSGALTNGTKVRAYVRKSKLQ